MALSMLPFTTIHCPWYALSLRCMLACFQAQWSHWQYAWGPIQCGSSTACGTTHEPDRTAWDWIYDIDIVQASLKECSCMCVAVSIFVLLISHVHDDGHEWDRKGLGPILWSLRIQSVRIASTFMIFRFLRFCVFTYTVIRYWFAWTCIWIRG